MGLSRALEAGAPIPQAEEQFINLSESLMEHFKTEEEFLEAQGYPSLAAHRYEHEILFERVWERLIRRHSTDAPPLVEILRGVGDLIQLHRKRSTASTPPGSRTTSVPPIVPGGRLRVPGCCADPPVRESLAAASSASPPAGAPRSHAVLPRLGWGFLRLAAWGRGGRSLECPGSQDGCFEFCSMKRRRIDSALGGRSSVTAWPPRSGARRGQADHAPVGRRKNPEPEADRKARRAGQRTPQQTYPNLAMAADRSRIRSAGSSRPMLRRMMVRPW